MVGINVEGFFWENEEPPGGGGVLLSFYGLHWKTPAERDISFRLQVYERG